MNWRKKIAASFFPLLAFLGCILLGRNLEKKVTMRQVASLPSQPTPKVHPRKILHPRVVAAFQGKINTDNILRNRIPQSLEVTFIKDQSIKLTKGYELLKDVAAISKKDFNINMGDVIQEKEDLIYFRAAEGHAYNLVAISISTHNLYPIASIIHIKGATAELRSSVLAQGLEEYYYHAPLKFLSIKSTPGDVLRIYHELKERGFRVELEVLRPKHKII